MRYFRGIVESNVAPSTDMLWINQKELKYFSNGKWESIDNKSITEELISSVTALKEDPKEYLEYVILELGSSKNIKTSNYDKLSSSKTNFIKIGDGFGIYTWDSVKGGQAHIITAYGNTIYYTINSKGAVEKGFESPDIYLDYINAGGTKTHKEFIKELVDLLG